MPTDDDRPATDDRHPAEVVAAMVDHVLALAATWTSWDGVPMAAGDRTCSYESCSKP